MMYDELISFVYAMDKEDFRQKMLRGVALKPGFSELSSSPETASLDTKKIVRDHMVAQGIPAYLIADDGLLLYATRIIMARAVQVG